MALQWLSGSICPQLVSPAQSDGWTQGSRLLLLQLSERQGSVSPNRLPSRLACMFSALYSVPSRAAQVRLVVIS